MSRPMVGTTRRRGGRLRAGILRVPCSAGRARVMLSWLGVGLVGLLLGGCSILHSRIAKVCPLAPDIAQARSLPPLKIPSGLSSPDTRGDVHIPALADPPGARADLSSPTAPCLAQPPPFVNTPVPTFPRPPDRTPAPPPATHPGAGG